ncbi:MAG TPA: histidine triad nucleotide-binding protein [Vicinamibacterales bacterium]|nr:histidine triad nucleotide-binding protein [Vicinamibacterales bacterium]
MIDCLFCKILKGEIPAAIIYEDERMIAFKDINPQAPLHALIVPKRHIASLNDLVPEDDALVGEMIRRAAAIARQHGYADRGFRTVFNTNAEAGQTVFHIHLHLLAGRGLSWPPG